jgi:hypothetical protein
MGMILILSLPTHRFPSPSREIERRIDGEETERGLTDEGSQSIVACL